MAVNSAAFVESYLQQVDLSGCFDNCNDYCVALWKLEYVQTHSGATAEQAAVAWTALSTTEQGTILSDCMADVCNPDEVNDDFDYPGEEPFTACEVAEQMAIAQISPGGIFYDDLNSSFWTTFPANYTFNTVSHLKSWYQDPANYTPEMAVLFLAYHREHCNLDLCDVRDASNAYSIGLTALVMNAYWNPSSGLFYEPYYFGVGSMSQDPFLNSPYNGTNLLQSKLESYIDDQYAESVANGTPWGCSASSWPTSGNLLQYIDYYMDCMTSLNTMTSEEIEEMRKILFLGAYNQVKQDLIRTYGCPYYDDAHALFYAR